MLVTNLRAGKDLQEHLSSGSENQGGKITRLSFNVLSYAALDVE